MASDASSSEPLQVTENTCILHVSAVDEKELKSFSDITWNKALEYSDFWQNYDNEKAQIAKTFLELVASLTTYSPGTSDTPSTSSFFDAVPRPPNARFHRQCYAKFTDKTKKDVAQRMMIKKRKQADLKSTDKDSTDEPTDKKTRIGLRSANDTESKTSQRRSAHVLPPVCIICKQASKRKRDKAKRTSTKEGLTLCELIDGGQLAQQATAQNDERILLQIKGQDCVAIEVRYHRSCHREYTRPLTRNNKREDADGTKYLSQSFNKFCEEYIEPQIMKEKRIIKLTKLKKWFVKTAKKEENHNAKSYKTHTLKRNLQARYPELKFVRPNNRSKSDMVYAEELTTATMISEDRCASSEQSDTTESESDEDTGIPPAAASQLFPSTATLQEIYGSALTLRGEIKKVSSQTMPWPPDSSHLTVDAAEKIVPARLFNFLAWMTGISTEPENENMVAVNSNQQRRLLSISQDIIYLASNGRKSMPKHTSLAMAVRHLTGSAQLIGLLNGFGHSTSHTAVLEHDTALAKKEILRGDNALPACLQQGIFTTLVWDNNDFGEETLSGKGTTHNTNGIAIQHEPSAELPPPQQEVSMKKTRERSMEAPDANIIPFFGAKKAIPSCFGTETQLQREHHKVASDKAKHQDNGYYITKYPVSDTHPILPGWTGFNQRLADTIPPKATIAYLPVVDATPTELSTVNTVLHRSIDIANALKLDKIDVVFDQAIYAKAQAIRWQTPLFTERIVIRLGAFHTATTFLACIGKRFRDAGLEDILIEAEVLAAGSANGVFNGRHYNRSLRCHKLMAEALQRLRWKAFLQAQSEEVANNYVVIIKELQEAFPMQRYSEAVDGEEFHSMMEEYTKFVEDKKKGNATFAYWCSYLDMVEIALQFIRGSRESNWSLHLSTLRLMMPWMFAYDRHNYARYLPVYWMEMQKLPLTHPSIYEQFQRGNFSVQRQSAYGFAGVACDMTIEQTVNKDSKTHGGLKGFTVNKGAVNRWTTGHHERASITRQCEDMAGRSQRALMRKDLTVGRITRDEADVEQIMTTIASMTNPFEELEVASTEIIHLASGVVASTEIADDLLIAEEKGEAAFVKYCEERLQTEDKSMLDTVPKSKLKTFTDMSKTMTSRVNGKEVTLKSDRDLFARLVIIGRVRNVDLRHMMTYSLGPLPLPIAKSDGCLVKTNKAKLMHILEKREVEEEAPPGPAPPLVPPQGGVWIVDGMALLQQLSQKNMPRTFGLLAEKLLKQLVNICFQNQSKCVHFVTDTYPTISIKNAERKRRAASGSQRVKISRADQNVPKQWKKFLANSHNKQQLVRFLLSQWKGCKADQLKGVSLVVAIDAECWVISTDDMSQAVKAEVVHELYCNHEEADTRMLLHAKYIAENNDSAPVIIRSPDTDVLVIAVGLATKISSRLYFHTGKEDKVRTIDVTAIRQEVGDDLAEALIGFHCFTGCDSVSSFYGKGKSKALTLLKKHSTLAEHFSKLGRSDVVSEEMANGLEEFVCLLYSHKEVKSVNEVRYLMLKTAVRAENVMPPNRDSLRKHIQRANFQANVFKQSLVQYQDLPSPVGNGWKMDGNDIAIDWMDLAPAPESVLELAFCKCKSSKCQPPNADDSCCATLGVRCTDLCQCKKCENMALPTEEEITEPDEADENGAEHEEELDEVEL